MTDISDGLRPEWDGTVHFARDPIASWFGIDFAAPGVRDRSVIAIQDTINGFITNELEVFQSSTYRGYIRIVIRGNSYQRRLARKPWLYAR